MPLLLLCTARPELFERQPGWGGGKRNATTISLSPLSTRGGGPAPAGPPRPDAPPGRDADRCSSNGPAGTRSTRSSSRACSPSEATSRGSRCPRRCRRSSRRGSTRCGPSSRRSCTTRPSSVGSSGAAPSASDRRARPRRGAPRSQRARAPRVRAPGSPLVRRGEDEFSFWHALVRDVAYQQIPRSPRAEKHSPPPLDRGDGRRAARGSGRDPRPPLRPGAGARARRRARSGRRSRQQPRRFLLAGRRSRDTARYSRLPRRTSDVPLDLAGDRRAGAVRRRSRSSHLSWHAGRAEESARARTRTAIRVLRDTDESCRRPRCSNDLVRPQWARGDDGAKARWRAKRSRSSSSAPGPELVGRTGRAALPLAIARRFEEARGATGSKGFALADELGVDEHRRAHPCACDCPRIPGRPALPRRPSRGASSSAVDSVSVERLRSR